MGLGLAQDAIQPGVHGASSVPDNTRHGLCFTNRDSADFAGRWNHLRDLLVYNPTTRTPDGLCCYRGCEVLTMKLSCGH